MVDEKMQENAVIPLPHKGHTGRICSTVGNGSFPMFSNIQIVIPVPRQVARPHGSENINLGDVLGDDPDACFVNFFA